MRTVKLFRVGWVERVAMETPLCLEINPVIKSPRGCLTGGCTFHTAPAQHDEEFMSFNNVQPLDNSHVWIKLSVCVRVRACVYVCR